MNKREEIPLDAKIIDILVLMAEGNPGAINVLSKLVQLNPILPWLLDDMNIRGTQIWIGYKDHCKQDIGRFVECILTRDKGMIDCVNKEGLMGNHKHKAVEGKASIKGREFLEVD